MPPLPCFDDPGIPGCEKTGIDTIEKEWFLHELIDKGLMDIVFQPILGLLTRNYLGFEALMRPRANPWFDNPTELFAAAERHGLSSALDRACRDRTLKCFAELGLPGTLFLNATPGSLFDPEFQNGATLRLMRSLDLAPTRIVIEITENQRIADFGEFRDVLGIFRSKGYRIAIDDLGQGMSNLRMWTEIHPDFVKIDRHFIDGIAADALKFQLVRAMHGMAETCGASLIAEGVERREDFVAIRDIGIRYAQGFLIERPHAEPANVPSSTILHALASTGIAVFPGMYATQSANVTARALLQQVAPVRPETSNEAVFARFEQEPELRLLPVVTADGQAVGVVQRSNMIDRYARPYRREIYGKRPCTQLMDASVLQVDESMPVQELSRLLIQAAHNMPLHEGFILTEQGRYLGVGISQALMSLITDMQIRAARYANPLTQLPGNVPINEHIERLLTNRSEFVACYADLDAFKPFNDVYGYQRGDEMILLLSSILDGICDPRCDFLGHIGGDDFLILFQSLDWRERCEQALEKFGARVPAMLGEADLARHGILTEDRLGRVVLHALPSLSIGALPICADSYGSHHEVAAAAAEAKKQAKRIPGNSLFVERRALLRRSG